MASLLNANAALNAERAAAPAGALHVRVVELEPGAFDRLDIVDFHAFQVHRAHLVHGHFETVKIDHFVRVVGLVLECHVILKSRASAADYRDSQRRWNRALHAHDFLHFGARYWSQTNHNSLASAREPSREALPTTSIANSANR